MIPDSRPGRTYPLGATLRDGGCNFALYSRHAEEVSLHLYDDPRRPPTRVVPLDRGAGHVWNVFLPDIAAGQRYGYKVGGPFRPEAGLRFHPQKLLIDPYARALDGKAGDPRLLLAYDPAHPARDLSFDPRPNDAVVPKSIVIDPTFDWEDDKPPGIAFDELFLYETHLKGFTAHASSGSKRPGTYLGFIDRIPHLARLGVNAVEFLPIHEFHGPGNYWGYSTIGFFAPESSYAASRAPGAAVNECKTLVRALHRAGIEVILDVVYNHTAEGNELGPTLSLRGIDNPSYYLLTGPPDAPGRFYENLSGCGNSLHLGTSAALRLVMDSLRYWVEEMHVDGFRFDLASILGRDKGKYDRTADFFQAVWQDPVLTRVKLIAEPWDISAYEVGNFPPEWAEWNGRFRDTVRRFVKGDGGQLSDLGARLTGSSDLFGDDGRQAYHSINLVTCHDGFTLNDLVSFNEKHNEANGESNRDGTDDNASWNCGVEGETDDPGVLALRRRQAKNLLSLLFFASGTPMLLGGDEFLRTQRGNNNAYGHDDEISWFDWSLAEKNADVVEFTRRAIDFVRRSGILQARRFHGGIRSDRQPVVSWFGPDGRAPGWNDPAARAIAYRLDPAPGPLPGGRAAPHPLLFLLNASDAAVRFALPTPAPGRAWRRVVDTALPAGEDFADAGLEVRLDPSSDYLATSHSLVVLQESEG